MSLWEKIFGNKKEEGRKEIICELCSKEKKARVVYKLFKSERDCDIYRCPVCNKDKYISS